MDRVAAREAAQALLDTIGSGSRPLRLVDDEHVADVGWAYVHDFNTVRFYETHAMADALGPGFGPIVVVKDTGEAFLLGSAPSYDEQLAAYAAAHGLPAPRPLGW